MFVVVGSISSVVDLASASIAQSALSQLTKIINPSVPSDDIKAQKYQTRDQSEREYCTEDPTKENRKEKVEKVFIVFEEKEKDMQ